jgi:hypothetical protein
MHFSVISLVSHDLRIQAYKRVFSHELRMCHMVLFYTRFDN